MHLTMSLLDRLLDNAPDLSRDLPTTRAEELRNIRDNFRRDIEALLNTRRTCISPPPAFGALKNALPCYGVDDFVGSAFATLEQRRALATSVEDAIRNFEPRFKSVRVSLIKSRDPSERRQTVRIEAVAQLEHGPEPLVFESALDPTTRSFSVE